MIGLDIGSGLSSVNYLAVTFRAVRIGPLAYGTEILEPPAEKNWRPTDYERTQEVAGRFRRVVVSRKIRELRVALIHRHASVGTGMVTGW